MRVERQRGGDAALERVLEDTQERERMGRAGRELVESRYTWPKIAEQCVAAYQRAATSASVRRPA